MNGPEIYEFLRETRALMQPLCCEQAEHKGLQRLLRIEKVSLDDESLTLVSYNGYDRRERSAVMTYRDLKMDSAAAFAAARDTVLTFDRVPRVYFVQALADEAIKGMEINGRGVEYDTWIDHMTDTVVVKGYRRHPRRAALGSVIPRDVAEQGDDAVRDFVRKDVQEMREAFCDEAKLQELGAYKIEGQPTTRLVS